MNEETIRVIRHYNLGILGEISLSVSANPKIIGIIQLGSNGELVIEEDQTGERVELNFKIIENDKPIPLHYAYEYVGSCFRDGRFISLFQFQPGRKKVKVNPHKKTL